MKKLTLIILGIALILIVGGIWAYLFIFGAPENSEPSFSNFGFGGNDSAPTVIDTTPIVDTEPIDTTGAPEALKQLTTRPVAGATFIEGGIRYAERGTGHIYDILFTDGSESLVISTTIPRVTKAVFSPSGSSVALVSETGDDTQTYVGAITRDDGGQSIIDGLDLPAGVSELSFSDSGTEVYYLQKKVGGSEGYSYDLAKQVNSTLFTIPLRDIEVLWGDDIYVYTSPSGEQLGYIYKLVGNTLQYVRGGGYGLMGTTYIGGVVTSEVIEGTPQSIGYELEEEYDLPIEIIPEKCTSITNIETGSMYCAAPLTLPSGSYPDDWYKGNISLSDVLWKVYVTDEKSALLSIPVEESGREIDVSQIGNSEDGTLIYFVNKNDDSLWMFDTTI